MSQVSATEHFDSIKMVGQASVSARVAAGMLSLSMPSKTLLERDGYGSELLMQDGYKQLLHARSDNPIYINAEKGSHINVTGELDEVVVGVYMGFMQPPKPGLIRRRDPGSIYRVRKNRQGNFDYSATVFPYSSERQLGLQTDASLRKDWSSTEGLGLFYPARALSLGVLALSKAAQEAR